MPSLNKLPTKYEFYATLNELVEEARQNMLARIPRARQNTYGGVRRYSSVYNKFVTLPPNSGRLRENIQPAGHIHMFSNGTGAKIGRMSIVVTDENLYDPIFGENYWEKVAHSDTTFFGNVNRHKDFWKPAYLMLVGNLQTYASEYATYTPSWNSKFNKDEAQEEKDIEDLERLIAYTILEDEIDDRIGEN